MPAPPGERDTSMATVRKTLAELKANPPRFSPEKRSYLLSLSDEDIERAARSDPDNPPLTTEQLERMAAARLARKARMRTGLTQPKFADRFRINLGRLRDLEQGRYNPDKTFVAYLKVIEKDPEAVQRALDSDAT